MNADEKSYDDINVTPMVDLYLVLLLIFIIMTTASVQGHRVNLPKASNAPAPPNPNTPKTQVISVSNEGAFTYNKQVMSLADLERHLGAVKARTPDVPVMVRGDSQTQYKAIMDVVDLAGRLGIKQINLTTPAPQ
jgi:biopolymer transport protein ExbD